MQNPIKDIAKELAAARAASIRLRASVRKNCRRNGLSKRKTLRVVQRFTRAQARTPNATGSKALRRYFRAKHGLRGTAAEARTDYAVRSEPQWRQGVSERQRRRLEQPGSR